jgi:hypothetical protein
LAFLDEPFFVVEASRRQRRFGPHEHRKNQREDHARRHAMKSLVVPTLCVGLLVGCGATQPVDDAGTDAGADASVDAGQRDAGSTRDAGFEEDAGPPPARSVFGSMVVNGKPMELGIGYGNTLGKTHQFRMGTVAANPRVLVVLVAPADAGAGWSGTCGTTPSLLLSAQWIVDAGIAYFTEQQVCQVAFSQVAQNIDDEYRGTFSATLQWNRLSAVDAGLPALTITQGDFRVIRSN